MARYNLILKDSVYVSLVQNAQKLGLSLGKYINKVLFEAVSNGSSIDVEPKCFICGGKPKVQVRNYQGVPLYLCLNHADIKTRFSTFKEVME